MLIVAHRGASHDAPEHTWHAYELAVEQGADAVEVDVHLTRDGEVVCVHDRDLARVAGVRSSVGDLDLDELRRLDVGSWFCERFPDRADGRFAGATVPTLAEVVDRLPGRVGLHVELKEPAAYAGRLEEAVAAVLTAAPREGRVVVESFDVAAVLRVGELAADAVLGAVWTETTSDLVAALLPEPIVVSAPNLFSVFLHPAHVTRAHDRGLEVHVWTADDEEEVAALAELGVDAVVTNRPALARAVVAAA